MNPFTFDSFRGGVNDFDPTPTLAIDECAVATNVDFWTNPCGSRRRGSTAISVTGPSSESSINFLYRHLPTNFESDAQLWAWGVTPSVSSTLAFKDTAWHNVSFNNGTIGDNPVLTDNTIYQMRAQTAHGKLFLCYSSAIDRLHVYDGTNVRRVGIAKPNAPGVVDSAPAGTFSGVRYYRCRLVTVVGGVVTRRSEPGSSTTFTPAGNKTGAVISQPGTSGDGETSWELEASVDNANFYRINTQTLGSGTFTDTQPFTSGYAIIGVLSDTIGAYSLVPSARYVTMDQDRLIFASSFFDATKASHIWWTPVYADPTGVANDERIPVATNNELDLDGYEGGPITNVSQPLNGVIYVFKTSQIYRLIRTGQVNNAYEPVCITKVMGAIEGSVVSGIDENGQPCVYFMDPRIGPCRLGTGGSIIWAGKYVWNNFQRINLDAAIAVRGLYYPDKKQIHWRIAADGSNSPILGLVLQTNFARTDAEGMKRGWAFWTGASMSVGAMCLFANNIQANTARSLKLAPFFSSGSTIQQMDTGVTDNGAGYVAQIVSAPVSLPGSQFENLQDKFGITRADVSSIAMSATMQLQLIRDFGIETGPGIQFSTAPVGSETSGIDRLDQAVMSECIAVQVSVGDSGGSTGIWGLNQIMLRPRAEERAE